MTTKVITSYANSGYTLAAAYDALLIKRGAGFSGAVYSNHFVDVTNYGSVGAANGYGLDLYAGADVHNGGPGATGAVIGYVTVRGGAGDVYNDGAVDAGGVYLAAGGRVVNGYAGPSVAEIHGRGSGVSISGSSGAVFNYADVRGITGDGVLLADGGSVTNGVMGQTTAVIEGSQGGVVVGAASGTLTNYGVVRADAADGVDLSAGGAVTNLGVITGPGYGVAIEGGPARVVNGTAIDTAATIEGRMGLTLVGAFDTVSNRGTIAGTGGDFGDFGVYLHGGGQVYNGAGATIEGYGALSAIGALTLANRGLVLGSNAGEGDGVRMAGGGTIVNGIAQDRTATIIGEIGVQAFGAATTVLNNGTILGALYGGGVVIGAGGRVQNGAVNNTKAVISGYGGVYAYGTNATVVANYATIEGQGNFGVGLYGADDTLTNGSSKDARALIDGYGGVAVSVAGVTVVNYGVINGETSVAVQFASAGDTLVVEAGSSFIGAVNGGGGLLDFADGKGTLTSLGGTAVVASGVISTTTFAGFGAIEVGQGASFKLTGKGTLVAGETLAAAGLLTTAALANSGLIETLGGTLSVGGAVTGKGAAMISGGLMDFASAFNEAVTFGATGTLELAQSQSFTATVTGFSTTGTTFLDLVDIGFVGAGEATFNGNANGGTLTVTDGTHTAHLALKGDYLSSTFVAASDGHGGVIIHDPSRGAPTPAAQIHALVAAMASLGAGGAMLAEAPEGAGRPSLQPLFAPRAAVA